MERKSKLTIAIVAALLVLGATAVYAQDKYSLKSSSGIAFSDFRGYEDWSVVSSARTDQVLKVIVGNPTMIAVIAAPAAKYARAAIHRTSPTAANTVSTIAPGSTARQPRSLHVCGPTRV